MPGQRFWSLALPRIVGGPRLDRRARPPDHRQDPMRDRPAPPPLEAARKLAPMIRAAADEIDANRELTRPVFEALADAGMFHLAVPAAIGGGEIDLPTYIQVIEELGKADASTGWCVNQGAIFATYAARMPREVAREIFITPPRAVVANTPAPTATAVVVKGGYRVTGRQGFSTGCRHATWVAAHCQVIDKGDVRMDAGAPEARYLFVPVGEAKILDTWTVRGMRGTGTHHFAVDDVFVPAHRTVLSATAPLLEARPLYQIPRTLLFASGDAAVAVGMARACLDAFFELAGVKTPRAMAGRLRDPPIVPADVGHAEADLRAGRALLTETVRDVWAEGGATNTISLDQRAALRPAPTHAIRLAVKVVDAAYNAAGATAVYESHLLQRHFQDIHVISQHRSEEHTSELQSRLHLV